MKMMKRIILSLLIITTAAFTAAAHDADSTVTRPESATIYADSISFLRNTPEWARRYLSSLIRGNVDRTHEKKFDMSVGVTPSYTREAGFGIGGMLTGLYRIDRSDSISEPSDIFASLNVSLNGFFVLTIKGNTLLPDHRSRLSYKMELYRKRLNFWGITSAECATNPESKYDRRQIDFHVEYVYRFGSHFYGGAQLRANYTDARHIADPAYLMGERHQYYVTGAGLLLEFDTRDNLLNPTKGCHVAYKPMMYPRFLGNAPAPFVSHTFTANAYLRLWRGSILAFDLYSCISTSNTPWTMRQMLASDGIRMRGYYMGSYIDNDQISMQAELRQHIYKRFGVVAWAGGATVFSSIKDYKKKGNRPEWLPNAGIGLRFEFKHNVNARIDYGFGRHTGGLVFAIGEAF